MGEFDVFINPRRSKQRSMMFNAAQQTDPSDARIRVIGEFVATYLKTSAARNPENNPDPSYRWLHTLRVSRYGKVIAESEGAEVELVVAACLLHDVARFDHGKTRDHGRLGAQIARPHLLETGYTPSECDIICTAVAEHVDVPEPQSRTSKILSDADNVDRFGAYRLAQQLYCGGADYAQRLEQGQKRLQQLRDYRQQVLMLTPSGQVLFNEKLDFQIAYLVALLKEREFSLLSELI